MNAGSFTVFVSPKRLMYQQPRCVRRFDQFRVETGVSGEDD
jgi:hypothetical protein